MSKTEHAARPIRLLGICGSLRKASLNRLALELLQDAAPASVQMRVFQRMAELPLFNPDTEHLMVPALEALKQDIAAADVLVIASPEYAHGISGVMKNALDHLVSSEEFVYKRVALINTSPRASHAQLALCEVLRTMSAQLIDKACVDLPLLGCGLSAEQLALEHSVQQSLLKMLVAIQDELSRD